MVGADPSKYIDALTIVNAKPATNDEADDAPAEFGVKCQRYHIGLRQLSKRLRALLDLSSLSVHLYGEQSGLTDFESTNFDVFALWCIISFSRRPSKTCLRHGCVKDGRCKGKLQHSHLIKRNLCFVRELRTQESKEV